MIDTKAKRAAALGYGLSFLLVLPPAHGALNIEDAGHALNAYRYDLPELVIEDPPTLVSLGTYGLDVVGVGGGQADLLALGLSHADVSSVGTTR